MRIDIIYKFDSQSKVFQVLQDKLSEHEVKGVLVQDKNSILNYIKNNYMSNVVILTLSGQETMYFVRSMQEFENRKKIIKRPFIVSMLVGISLDRSFYSTLMQRAVADVVLVNNIAQLKKVLSVKSSSIDFDGKFIASLPVIFNKYKINNFNICTNIKCILFIVQNDIPKTKKDRMYVVNRLIDYAYKYTTRTIIIKPRIHLNEEAAHPQKYPYESLFYEKCRGNIPTNIIFSYDPISDLIDFCDLAISFSSTAILEVLLAGKSAAVIGDLGIAEGNGVSYFVKSNLITSFNELLEDRVPNILPRWLKEELNAPDIDTTLNSLQPDIICANEGLIPFSNTVSRFVDEYQRYKNPSICINDENLINILHKNQKKHYRHPIIRRIKSFFLRCLH